MAVITVSPKKVFNLINLPSSRVVQKTYIDFPNKTIYALQLYGSDPTKNAVLSSGHFSATSSGNFVSGGETVDMGNSKMILNNFGHGETLEKFTNPYDPNGIWFWITTGANYDTPDGSYFWGHQIGIVKYSDNSTIDYTQIHRISSISSLTASGKAFGKLLRTDAGLSSDGSKLIIMSEADDKTTRHLSCLATSKVIDAMYASSTMYIGGDEALFRSKQVLTKDYNFTHHLPWNSQQGLEFSNDNKVYISGGAKGEAPHILKGDWSFTAGNYQTVSLTLPTADAKVAETEGVQLYGDNVYLGVDLHYSPKTHTVLSFPKNKFTV